MDNLQAEIARVVGLVELGDTSKPGWLVASREAELAAVDLFRRPDFQALAGRIAELESELAMERECGDRNAAEAFDLIHDLSTRLTAAKRDAEIGRITLNYIDRISDPSPSDPWELSVRDLLAAFDDMLGADAVKP